MNKMRDPFRNKTSFESFAILIWFYIEQVRIGVDSPWACCLTSKLGTENSIADLTRHRLVPRRNSK